jgi:quercetin dioxygenase-like cupin family protein
MLLSILIAALVLGDATVEPVGAHQHGTPAPGGGSGVTTEVLGAVEPTGAPGQALYLLRVTFAPGGSVAAHVHPGATIYHIASGELRFTLHEGQAQVVRAITGVPAAATPAASVPIPLGEEIVLVAGDTVFYDGSAVQVERNDGDQPAVVLVSNLRGTDEPARRFAEGTPPA